MAQSAILKKILEAIKELVNEANFECTNAGISLQAMDTSHVALVGLLLRADGFDHYRCDRSLSLGINLTSMAKILKCAGNEDTMTLKADEDKDIITFMFESPSKLSFCVVLLRSCSRAVLLVVWLDTRTQRARFVVCLIDISFVACWHILFTKFCVICSIRRRTV